MARINAKATVVVMLEIPVGDTWGAGCTVDQLLKQGGDAARGIVRHAIDSRDPRYVEASGKRLFPRGTRLLGEPKVTGIITGEVE